MVDFGDPLDILHKGISILSLKHMDYKSISQSFMRENEIFNDIFNLKIIVLHQDRNSLQSNISLCFGL